MDPRLRNYLEDERRWSLAAEVSAHLAEIARWEWSEHAEEAARLARRLADEIYHGETPDGLTDIVEHLSEAMGNGPAEWLAALTDKDLDDNPVPPDFHHWRADARRAFYALRADLYPDGRWQAA